MRKALLLILLLALAVPALARDKWAPISQEELQMKDNPLSPGDHAMILEREVESNDTSLKKDWTKWYFFDRYYFRIKIFTDTGRQWGTWEIPELKQYHRLVWVKARSIAPDGTVTEFDGEVFDKVVHKSRRLKFTVKAFTIPNVQVGSVLEVIYTIRREWVGNRWVLSAPLFTRKARFRYDYYSGSYSGPELRFTWVTLGVGPEHQPKKVAGDAVEMEMHNIPAFRSEPYMPPEDDLKARVQFTYRDERTYAKGVDEFWRQIAKDWNDDIRDYLGKPDSMRKQVAEIVAESDPPEGKLRKLYARVQQLRNTTYERDKTEAEQRREKRKENTKSAEVWSRGYGDRADLTRVFVSMARSAGFDAALLKVARRDTGFFNRNLLDEYQLNSELAWVSAGGKEYFLDPGTPYCPFGLISWERSGVHGMKFRDEGAEYITTPKPTSEEAVIERKAEFTLAADGSMSGPLQITFRGQEALNLRLDNRRNDEVGKTKQLEEEIRRWLPASAAVEITKVTGWTDLDEPLVVEAKIAIPDLAVPTGKRLLLPKGILQTRQSNPLAASERLYHVYFEYPFQERDEIDLIAPAGLTLEATALPRQVENGFGTYTSVVQRRPNGLRIVRKMSVEGMLFAKDFYPDLRSFYNIVRAGDEESLVMQSATTAGK